jgi:RNA polymerase sigma factor (sigma-70 family)
MMGVVALNRPFPSLYTRPLERLSDERLASLVHAGNDDAFAALFDRYRESLARYCRTIVRSPEDACDAQQNAMLGALRALRARRLRGRVRPWLYRVAHNESINVMRRRREHAELDEGVPAPGAHEHDLERWESLIADLRSLPERQRGALMMRELGGLDYHEIAAALSMKPASARKAVFEARAALSESVAGRDAHCEEIRGRISDFDGRVMRARRVRSHLESCAACGVFALSLRERRDVLGLIPVAPAALIAAAGGAGAAGLGTGGVAGVKGGSGIGSIAFGGGSAGSAVALKGIATCALCVIAGAGVAIDAGTHHHRAHHSVPRAQARVAHRAERHASGGVAAPAVTVASANVVRTPHAARHVAPGQSIGLPRRTPSPRVGGRPVFATRPQVHAPASRVHPVRAPRVATHSAVPASTPAAIAPMTTATPVSTAPPAPTTTTTTTPTPAPQPASSGSPSITNLALKLASAGMSLAQQATAQALAAAQQQLAGQGSSSSGSGTASGTGSIAGVIGHFWPRNG